MSVLTEKGTSIGEWIGTALRVAQHAIIAGALVERLGWRDGLAVWCAFAIVMRCITRERHR